ncbi:MAG TPA: sterol desaturase family protein [Polyangiaceae bacterium]|nr:sterol desaturase family protein [Polyangiaceae bacterium]
MPPLTSLAPIFVVLFFGGGMLLERFCAARPLPQVAGWYLRASLMFVPTMAIGAFVPLLVAERCAGHSPLHLEVLGTWGGALVGVLCSDFVAYWLHRAQHENAALWRFTHQLHHSAERVDVLGAAYFHPLDIAIGSLLTSGVVAILGLATDAVAVAALFTLFMGVLQHLNLKTPVWLGLLVQRPESHSLHHARGLHQGNYGNLALWDMVFGTFRNPAEFTSVAGFYDGASRRVGAMLLGRDIQREPSAKLDSAVTELGSQGP